MVNLVPVIVTLSPPASFPTSKTTDDTTGTLVTYLKWSAGSIGVVPSAAVTFTSTVDAAFAGDTAVIVLGETTVKVVAGVEPNDTAVTPTKSDPLIATRFPPSVEPILGVMF